MTESSAENTQKDLDIIMANWFLEETPVVKRETALLEARTDSALAYLIDEKIQTKSLPLALRKRLMYQRAIQAGQDKLKVNDEIIFKYNNINYHYLVDKIFEEEKDGDIEITKSSDNQLVLTTCSKKDSKKQLIVNSNLIQKEEIT